MVRIAFFFFLSLLSITSHSAVTFGGVVSFVTDGDTLWVQPDRGGATRKLRLLGIDAPEICQAGGEQSRRTLSQLVLHKRVSVTVAGNDVYGRGLARVFVNNKDIGALMVGSGHAWSYRWNKGAGPYAHEQAFAQNSHLGLFNDRQAVTPQVFRKRHGTCHTTKRPKG